MSLLLPFRRRKVADVIPLQPRNGHADPLDDAWPTVTDHAPQMHRLDPETADWDRERAAWDRHVTRALRPVKAKPFVCSTIDCGDPATWFDPNRAPGETPIRKCAAHEPRAYLSVVDGGA